MASIANMNMDVVIEAKNHAKRFDVETEITFYPEEEKQPFIISYKHNSDETRLGIIMLFPQRDLYFTSAQLSFIIMHIRQMEEAGGEVLLVFNEQCLERVRRILDTTGVTNHAQLAVYTEENSIYQMQWSLD